jgi:hypothetical protein
MDRPAACHTRGMDDAVESVGNRLEHGGDCTFVGDVSRDELEPRAEIVWRSCQIGSHHGAALGQ